MKGPIAVVGGTGSEGRGLALRWARAGEHIIIGSRDAQRAQATAEQIRAQCGPNSRADGAENSVAVAQAETVVLTVPFRRAGRITQDAQARIPAQCRSNRCYRTAGDRSWWPPHPDDWRVAGFGAQQAAELLSPGVAVVAALHNVSRTLLETDAEVQCGVIVCTDHEPARSIAFASARRFPECGPWTGASWKTRESLSRSRHC